MSVPNGGEEPEYKKSTLSGEGNCLEVAQVGDWILLRNSRHPESEFIRLTLGEWSAFKQGIERGELHFD